MKQIGGVVLIVIITIILAAVIAWGVTYMVQKSIPRDPVTDLPVDPKNFSMASKAYLIDSSCGRDVWYVTGSQEGFSSMVEGLRSISNGKQILIMQPEYNKIYGFPGTYVVVRNLSAQYCNDGGSPGGSV